MFQDLQQFQTFAAEHIERLPQICLQLLSNLLCRIYPIRRGRSPETRTTEFDAKSTWLCGTKSSQHRGMYEQFTFISICLKLLNNMCNLLFHLEQRYCIIIIICIPW